jgi:hypothetical protein
VVGVETRSAREWGQSLKRAKKAVDQEHQCNGGIAPAGKHKGKIMEYSLASKINKSPKEKRALIDAPVPSYNKESVDKEIKRSKVQPSESKAIHALLKGRYASGGGINLKDCKINTAEHCNPKHKNKF